MTGASSTPPSRFRHPRRTALTVIAVSAFAAAAVWATGAGPLTSPTDVAEATTPTLVATPNSATTPLSDLAVPSVVSGTSVLDSGSFFSSASSFNQKISSWPAIDPNSATMVQEMSSSAAVADTVEYGVPVYVATSSTPRQHVTCTAGWGLCPLALTTVPIDDSWTPSPGSDGAMVVVDPSTGLAYEFWQAWHGNSGWYTSWGGVVALGGSGWGGVATATGASRLAGVVLLSELQNQYIPHALAVQTSYACKYHYRLPAYKTDGTNATNDCVPEGSRIQLDPSIDLDSLSLTPAQHTIAVALQQYGAYVVDRGGASLSMSFQTASDASGSWAGQAYQDLGLGQDYQAIDGIPWSDLRVLDGPTQNQ